MRPGRSWMSETQCRCFACYVCKPRQLFWNKSVRSVLKNRLAGSLFFQLSGRSNILPLLSGRGIAEVFPTFFCQRFEPGDNLGMLISDVAGFADVGVEVEQRHADPALRVFPGFAIVTWRFGMRIIVRKVQLPFAAAHGLQMLVPVVKVGFVRRLCAGLTG